MTLRLDLLRALQLLEVSVGRLHGGLLGLEVGERGQGAQALDFLLRHLERAHGVVMAGLRLLMGRLGRRALAHVETLGAAVGKEGDRREREDRLSRGRVQLSVGAEIGADLSFLAR